MVRLNHYLYKYPQSNNFYFKIRIPSQLIRKYSLVNQFFIGSLRTADINVAQRLALTIKPLFIKECSMYEYSEALSIVQEINEQQAKEDMQGEKWDFRKYLKGRFQEYLTWGKQAIAAEIPVTDTHGDLPDITENDIKTFQQYLKCNQTKKGFTGNSELLAQKNYLLSFLNDYAAFTRTNHFKREKQASDSQLSLSQATTTEKLFSEFGYGESYAKAFPCELYTDDPDGEAVSRFVARHLSLEFDFKKSLVKELKKYKQDFDSFSEEAFDSEGLSPTKLHSFNEMFETLQETISTIKEFKEDQKAKVVAANAVNLSDMVPLFLVEKAKSTKPDTVRQYEIAFEYLYSLIGKDYDISNFDREKAVEVKESLLSKYANGEKGRKKESISVATLNKYLSNYGAFFNWCYQHSKISQGGQFAKLAINETDSNTNFRRSYVANEIEAIKGYEPNHKSEAKDIRADAYWFPKVALYTGMRLNEISAVIRVRSRTYFKQLTQRILRLGFKHDRILSF